MYKFSGHDTFHCRQNWLPKGIQLIENQGVDIFHDMNLSITSLGVGKNMVQALQYWLRSFGLVTEKLELHDLTKNLFTLTRINENQPFDKYLEDEGTLWLLQYKLCAEKYASIYNLIFGKYFKDKIKYDFTEYSILNFLEKNIELNAERAVSKKTLSVDFKVFIKTYFSPEKQLKTIEDDFNAPLLELNLISKLKNERSDYGEPVYILNKEDRPNFPIPIFAYCLLEEMKQTVDIQFNEIRNSLGNYFCLSNDGLENIIDELCSYFPSEFVYKNDAGIRQIQLKIDDIENYKNLLLQEYYTNENR